MSAFGFLRLGVEKTSSNSILCSGFHSRNVNLKKMSAFGFLGCQRRLHLTAFLFRFISQRHIWWACLVDDYLIGWLCDRVNVDLKLKEFDFLTLVISHFWSIFFKFIQACFGGLIFDVFATAKSNMWWLMIIRGV